ncbi:MAG TPA: hypothetical protein VFQ70_01120 [Candidatus Saccharimonadaceae bacterium]|nr:hypothetical protein [Candidatus Saccharimonadaceae bacterium]
MQPLINRSNVTLSPTHWTRVHKVKLQTALELLISVAQVSSKGIAAAWLFTPAIIIDTLRGGCEEVSPADVIYHEQLWIAKMAAEQYILMISS